jgi:hypothetical protein
MSKELMVIVEGTSASGKAVQMQVEMSARELLGNLKQMVKSLAQTGIVHEIEDRKNPFNAIQVDHFEVFRAEDGEEIEDDEDDEDDDLECFDDGSDEDATD